MKYRNVFTMGLQILPCRCLSFWVEAARPEGLVIFQNLYPRFRLRVASLSGERYLAEFSLSQVEGLNPAGVG